jgi:filamentous hemagglutinin family protein
MNHAYRLIWNDAAQAWVPVAEFARARGKGRAARSAAASALVLAMGGATAWAAPAGGQVSAGSGSIAQQGAVTTVTQTSPKLAINWHSFSSGVNETINFVQPDRSAIALNRVLGSDPSALLGKLNANGQVWLLNPNGILFGQSAQVNVGGLVAAALNLSDADFLAGKRTFTGSGGTVQNRGSITAGYAALLGEQVSNDGVIVARLGTAALAAGNQVTLDFDGDRLLNVQVDAGALHALAENKGLVQADGGTVLMTARAKDALLESVVNNTGIVRARSLENRAGRILLLGDMDSGTAKVGGTLDASAPDGGSGGFIETSAAHVRVADDATITTRAASGNNGTWLIDPVDFTVAAGSGALTTSGIGADTLSTSLGGGNVAIATDAGTGGNGDIFVNSAVSWSANKLTLTAHRNIAINANLNGSGTASLALEYGQASAGGGGSNYTLSNGAQINLPAGGNFSTKLGTGGATTNYTVITGLGAEASSNDGSLQGMVGTLGGNYALGANIDASGTSSWNANAGFTPVGTSGSQFTGSFHGLGHTITGLTINRGSTNYVGLFGVANAASTLRDVGLLNSNVTGQDSVGTLAGLSFAAVSYSYADGGSVTATRFYAGGLVGESGNSNSMSHSYANVGVGGLSFVGGLVGHADGAISNSYATGSVSGNQSVGGLVGKNFNNISNSYATGSVSGQDLVGGLVGSQELGGNISRSYATGPVTRTAGASTSVGGLVGQLKDTVSDSYWDSVTTGWGGVGSIFVGGNVTSLTDITATPYAQASYGALDFTVTPVWRIYEGHTRPLLKSFLTPVTLTPAFTGSGSYGDIAAYTANLASVDASKILGATLAINSTGTAGQASASLDLYSTQRGYDITSATRTLTGTGSAANSVRIGDAITWTSGTLKLHADQDIAIDANLNGSGTAKLALEYGQGAVAAGNTSTYTLGNASKVSLPAGGNFSTRLGSNGATTPWTVITSLGVVGSVTGTDLQGMNGGFGGNYVLGADIDASGTATWNANAGFTAVGNSVTKFTGNFDGLGHTITGLTINRPDNVAANNYQGLFGWATGALRNVGLLNSSISGLSVVGTLAGRSDGSISYSYADGGSATGSVNLVGGLVGQGSGAVNYSYANVAVLGTNSFFAASSNIGGLIGGALAGSSISNSYSTGSVNGSTYVGGLVGQNHANITNSFATGAVTSVNPGGGFIGDQLGGTITNSYWDSATTTQAASIGSGAGGTVASLTDIAAAPNAQASYTGFDFAGSWRIYEGHTRPLLKNFLTPLTVTANAASKTYDGAAYGGGNGVAYSTAPNANLLGAASYGGSSQGAVNVGSYVITPSGYWSNQKGYDIAYANGALTVNAAPLVVIAIVTPLSVTANNVSKTYDGLAWRGSNGVSYSGFVNGETSAALGGTLTYGGSAQGAVNAGTYVITPSGLTSGNYAIRYVNGTLTVNPAPLTVTANNVSKTYERVGRDSLKFRRSELN